MVQKPLDAKEISELSSSSYVASIIHGRIMVTSEFKLDVYAHSEEECKRLLAEMILEVKASPAAFVCGRNVVRNWE